MLLFSEINNPNNVSFYLKFRKDYDLKDFEYVNVAIETISKDYLTLQIRYDENGDFKQYYTDVSDVNVETFDVLDDDFDSIDVLVKIQEEHILVSIKNQGVEFNPVIENDNLEFDNISVLNKIADKIDYAGVLGLNSTVITIKNS